MTRTAMLATGAALLTACAAFATAPVVSNVRMTQRTNSRMVDILYDLDGEAAIVTLGIETNGVPIPDSAVTHIYGDVCRVVQTGANRSIVWNAGADWPENQTAQAKARITAWSTNAPPQYMVIDLENKSASSYPVFYYPSEAAIPGGITNRIYKTYRLAMRYIPPTSGAGFYMGSPIEELGRNTSARENQKQTYLTKGYYIGVYEVTQQQWYQVMYEVQAWPSKWSNVDYRATRPAEQVSYYRVRENALSNTPITPHWPATNSVGEFSFMGKLRAKTGNEGLDLPTEAQWEYACRAGTTGALHDGTVNIASETVDASLAQLGRYAYNGGRPNGTGTPVVSCATNEATAEVGSYIPNAWGLYDMHGNVFEWCLDGFDTTNPQLPGGTDPVGVPVDTARIRRSGSWAHPAKDNRSALRSYGGPHYETEGDTGFRLTRTLQ